MRKRFIWLWILIAVIFSLSVFYQPILRGVGRALIVSDKLEPVDIIIVLAGDNNGERVDEGVKLYRQGLADRLLMSGGPMAWRLAYAEWMKKQAQTLGVPSGAIFVQDQSLSTLEDAKFSLPILKNLGVKSVILVTSPTHTRRARRVFKRFLDQEEIKMLVHPVSKSSFKLEKWWTRHEDTQLVVFEYISFVFYFLKGY
ncbi:YdcF family protein [Candidatus Margulisiibacteriota bacterium]